ncbi:hypothetical protein SO802_022308 [Lithocarpus litseifolius]|uniref:Uncharacterized protein n=1 Tax=Lithocarpus litseifolius TaxID=425828 RepID=A0AAW2CJP3_9ROSI
MGEAEVEQVGGSPERDDPGRDHEENVEKNLTKPSNDMFKPGISDLISDHGLPSTNTTEMDIEVADSSNSGRFTDDQPKSQFPQHEPSSTKKTQTNPYRNVGGALEEWKERVKVSVDL